jgi:hypothetical protein
MRVLSHYKWTQFALVCDSSVALDKTLGDTIQMLAKDCMLIVIE